MASDRDGSDKGVSRRLFLQSTTTLAAGSLVASAAAKASAEETETAIPAETTQTITLRINGEERSVDVESRTTLLDALRERIGLTGTKVGCNHGQCGACTVIVDGRRSLSCLTLALSAQGRAITTVEGIADGENLHPVQAAFIEHDGFQCGYCTPGQICSGVALVDEIRQGYPSAVTEDVRSKVSVDEALAPAELRERMSGNICRCAAYNGIVAALEDGVTAKLAEANR